MLKNKKFDSVKMMRNIRDEVTEEFKNLSSKELIQFLNRKYPDFDKKAKSKHDKARKIIP